MISSVQTNKCLLFYAHQLVRPSLQNSTKLLIACFTENIYRQPYSLNFHTPQLESKVYV